MAETLSFKLDDIERIDRMIATTEVRRNAILRELDRHRRTVEQDPRPAAQQIDGVELKLIEARPPKKRPAA